MNAEKCPKCGANETVQPRSAFSGKFGRRFVCGTTAWNDGEIREAPQCKDNQLAQAQAENARLQAVVEAAAEYLSQYEGVYDMAVPTSHQSEQAKAAERRLRAALSATPSKGEVLAVVDSTVYMQDNAAWLSIIKLPPMPDQPVTVTVRRREEER
jgi:hypothetical protein